jgi:hypothetical protein
MFLHAASVTIVHPATKQTATYSAPLPKDLSDFLARLAQPDAETI